jgi:hypothetical protein
LEAASPVQSPTYPTSGAAPVPKFSEDDSFNIAMLMKKHNVDRSTATLLYFKQKHPTY